MNLDLYERNYFFDRAVLDEKGADWLLWRDLFEAAKQGDFSRMPELVDIFSSTRDPLLQQACVRLLGDAGSTGALSAVHDYVARHLNYDDPLDTYRAVDIVGALAQRGWLADIEIMLSIYEWVFDAPDSVEVPLHLSWMLEPQLLAVSDAPSDERSFSRYRLLVLDRARQLGKVHASMRVSIFLGEILHVPRLAQMLLDRMGRSHNEEPLQPRIRRRIEASTGIDCSAFFEHGKFRPLTTASMLESMLESDQLKNFAPGQRYFFGFPVP